MEDMQDKKIEQNRAGHFSFKNINKYEIISIIKFIIVLVPAFILRFALKDIWIVSERKDQARDNGYCFFEYLTKKHPERKVYYLIDYNASDYNKVKKLGETIRFDSWKHYLFFCVSRVHISAHVGGCCPSNSPICRFLKPIIRYKDVFLPHGVSYGVSEFCLKKYAKIDLFITSGKPEYQNVLANYGYSDKQVVYTGFPRLDKWHNIKIDHNQILLMPTWRLYLAQNPNTIFENTNYFRSYRDLITNAELKSFLIKNELKMVFYLHHGMQKYVGSFFTDCPNIEIVYKDDIYDIQELLKSAALLITDYSSVHFDFAYMGKPVLYYQFDREEFWQKQYKQSGFDAKISGFGPVAYDLQTLIKNIMQSFNEKFTLQGDYYKNMEKFYVLRDEHNCDRVYLEIVKRFG